MRFADRVQVGYVGTAPVDWVEIFGEHSLELRSVAAAGVRAACESGLRALIVPFKDWKANRLQLAKLIAAIDVCAANNGSLVAIAVESSPSASDDVLGASSLVVDPSRAATKYVAVHIHRLKSASSVRELAEVCRRHLPGPKATPSLESELLKNTVVGSPGATLLSRAFSDYAHLDVSRLDGGRSAASNVWLVKAKDHQKFAATPFVVKMGALDDIRTELANFEYMIMDSVPFPYRPPTIADRCVTGKYDQLLVTKFISEAVSLEHYIRSSDPIETIDLLYDGPLANWRHQASPEKMQLGVEYEKRNVLPDLAYGDHLVRLQEVFAIASGLDRSVLPPETMIHVLKKLPKIKVNVCKAHGDLHLRNIFVRERSGEVMLIDFALCTADAPSSYDPATLDVALALDHPEDSQRLSIATLRHFYAPPILGRKRISERRHKHRLVAIKQVRKRAAALISDAREYDIAVACRLLWYARKLKHPAAYMCASQIINSFRRKRA